MMRLLPWVVALALVAGCGVQPSDAIAAGEPPQGALAPLMRATIYLLDGDRLAPVTRPARGLAQAEVLRLLAEGPSGKERERKFSSDVPRAAAPFTVSADPGGRLVVTVSVLPQRLSRLAVEQIVCTAAATTLEGRVEVTVAGGGQRIGPWSCPDVPPPPIRR